MYEILNKRLDGLNVITEVEFTFDNGDKARFEITHFAPTSKEEIINSIQNRLVSEERNRNLPTIVANAFNEL